MSKLNIVLLGAPGSGKGTQATKLSRWLDIPHISTGEILRRQIEKGDAPLSSKIKRIVERGDLVSDEIVLEVVQNRFLDSDCANGYLLDGFPRNLSQAQLMYRELSEEQHVSKVLFLDVNHSDLFKRLTGRRVCSKCSKTFNIYYDDVKEMVCDKCGGELIIRADDQPDTVEKRLEVYKEITYPLIEYYRNRKILQTIDGNRSIEDVFEELKEVFAPHG